MGACERMLWGTEQGSLWVTTETWGWFGEMTLGISQRLMPTFSFPPFYGHTHGIWKFPGQRSNQSCSWSLYHSHSNAASELHLWPMLQLAATLILKSLNEARTSNLHTYRHYVRFLTQWATPGTLMPAFSSNTWTEFSIPAECRVTGMCGSGQGWAFSNEPAQEQCWAGPSNPGKGLHCGVPAE